MPKRFAGPLSDAAQRDRVLRRKWAAPGSSHDRIIAASRILMPATALGLTILLAVAPVTEGREISFVLSKNRVSMAPERLRVTSALYRGQDNSGQPFALTAASAVQARSTDPIVQLQTLNAQIGLQAGPATLSAPTGAYDTTKQTVALNGPVKFRSHDGYHIDTHDVDLDMKTRALASRAPVSGQIPLGTFSADRLNADLDKHTLLLTGNARLHIDQGRGKARP